MEEDLPLFQVDTLQELYAAMHAYGKPAFAIPHHTGYRSGVRGRDWSVFEEALTPFTEVFSKHGCSETDEEWIGLRQNSHMGPGYGGGTYQAALDCGHWLGAICSTDNWGPMPAHFGNGRMAALAKELTRESLWEAFAARRVYGVSGDRIELDFRIGAATMGDRITERGAREISVSVRGGDAIDRIEILKNGRVIATHCHQGAWTLPGKHETSRFKLRLEMGWGPRPQEIPAHERQWDGTLSVKGGRVIGCEPCWISPQDGVPETGRECCAFAMKSRTQDVEQKCQNAYIFEIEAEGGSIARIALNGLSESASLLDLASCSRELWYRDECVSLLQQAAGVEPESPVRVEAYHHTAYKCKVHRPMPEAAYAAKFEYIDRSLAGQADCYRVRVEQRNGQRAWSSPIWVSSE